MTATSVEASFVELTGHEVIEEFLSGIYTQLRLRGDRGRAMWRHQRVDAGAFALDTMDQTTTLQLNVEPLNKILVVRSGSMRLEYTWDGEPHRYGPGDVQLAAYPDQPYAVHLDHGRLDTCMLEPHVLTRVAATAPSPRPGPVRFTSLEPRSPAMATQFWATHSSIADLLATPEAAVSPLVVANATNLLAAVTLATFPNTTLTDPTIEDRHDAHPDTLHRAIAFIESHPADDITIADIAAAAFVSPRAVQLVFRRHLDTTPMAYLRRVRLAAAHADLVAADPTRTTVTTIATRWGYAHPGRFADAYRRAYGQPPSTTLNH